MNSWINNYPDFKILRANSTNNSNKKKKRLWSIVIGFNFLLLASPMIQMKSTFGSTLLREKWICSWSEFSETVLDSRKELLLDLLKTKLILKGQWTSTAKDSETGNSESSLQNKNNDDLCITTSKNLEI